MIFYNNSPLAATNQEKAFSTGTGQEILATKSHIAHIREQSSNDIERARMAYTQALINCYTFYTVVGGSNFFTGSYLF